MTALTDPYDRDDFYGDVALPNSADLEVVHDTAGADEDLVRELLTVVQELAASVERGAHTACQTDQPASARMLRPTAKHRARLSGMVVQ
jgi:hypothetical protein